MASNTRVRLLKPTSLFPNHNVGECFGVTPVELAKGLRAKVLEAAPKAEPTPEPEPAPAPKKEKPVKKSKPPVRQVATDPRTAPDRSHDKGSTR